MQTFYKFRHSDSSIEKKSSSGGAFTMLSDKVLNTNGIVYGCVLDENLNAVHIRADNKETRNRMRGSKYIQSELSSVYSSIAADLKKSKKVLFSGTPCQVSAVKKYLWLKNISIDNFISVEVICHGVGSSLFFHDYVADKEKKYHSKAVAVNFRSKYRVGQKQDMTIQFENGNAYHAASTNLDWFYSIYLKNLILRPSCYKCKFAKMERDADISIADFWDSEEKESFSLIVSNTGKGESLLEEPINGLITAIDNKMINQPHMKAPCEVPKRRDEFWEVYLTKGYEAVQTRFDNNTLKGKIKYCTANVLQLLHIAGFVKKIIKKEK